MTTAPVRPIRERRLVQPAPDAPAFRRRHRALVTLLALHLPALAVLATTVGRPVDGLWLEAGIVVLALGASAVLDLSARARALVVTLGLLWCSAVVAAVTLTLVWGWLHAATVGLLAAAHLGAAWHAPRARPWVEVEPACGTAEAVDADRSDAGTGAAESAPPGDDGLVAVQDVYTGVWSAKHLVRPETRWVRRDEARGTPASCPGGVDPRATAPSAAGASAALGVTTTPTVDADRGSAAGRERPMVSAAGRGHLGDDERDLTREVLEALHLSSLEL